MDSRYEHPQVAALWSPEWTYEAWWQIELAIIQAQRNINLIDTNETAAFVEQNLEIQPHPGRDSDIIQQLEKTTKHDVAAFVQYMREWWGYPHSRWIHYGVTSSDLVDTAQGMRFRALRPTLHASVQELWDALATWEANDTLVLGMTHGQPAEPTSIAIRAGHWGELVQGAAGELLKTAQMIEVAKIAGPVGTYAHNPPEVEMAVALTLRLSAQQRGASQITPRGALARWANAAAGLVQACSKIAMDMRLMNLIGELREPKTDGQVGSSSMGHKNNLIRAEQINGLARLALGYAVSLQPLDLWLERDISNSSVERIAVPDLWHLTLHVVEQTTQLLRRVELNHGVTEHHLMQTVKEHSTARATNVAIWAGDAAEDAREWATTGKGADEASYDPAWFVRNHPSTVGE